MELKNRYQNNGMFWQDRKDGDDYFIWRYQNNPIVDLKKNPDLWHVCNSAVVRVDGKYKGIFRVEYKDATPTLIYGESEDGINFTFGDEVTLVNEDGTPFYHEYAYDPRIIVLENEIYIVFCAEQYGTAIFIGKTKDFHTYTIVNRGFLPHNRNGVLFPEKFGDYYYMLSRPCNEGNCVGGLVYLSESTDLVHWGNHKYVTRQSDVGWNRWECVKIGPGPTPIKTKEGWLVIYHGVTATCNAWTYSFGVMLLDLKDPSKVIAKAKRLLLAPEEIYEKTGFTDNVIFPTTALVDDEGHVSIYYGCADTNLGIAFTTVDKLLEFVKKYKDKSH
ncbi:MAG: glycoside hydrolase family 130 protein [Bacilli bacterium]|nr:glycoside hydrolase family 130 protein [Bacilli bacterium]